MSVLRVPVNSRDHIKGPANAPVELVEYGDYQCPYCGAAHPVVKFLQDRYRHSMRFVFRHFPLTEIHPMAAPAAEAAEYAADYGRVWEMHDAIYENQQRLSIPVLFQLAGALGLSQIGLRDSIAQMRHADKIQADFIGGVRSGVNGTPTFFINGVRHNGGYSVPELSAAIEDAMAASLEPAR